MLWVLWGFSVYQAYSQQRFLSSYWGLHETVAQALLRHLFLGSL